MLIFVRFVGVVKQSPQALDVQPHDTIEMVKVKCEEKVGVPAEKQLLTCGSKLLEDWRTLSDYDIQQESTLHVRVRVPVRCKDADEEPQLPSTSGQVSL